MHGFDTVRCLVSDVSVIGDHGLLLTWPDINPVQIGDDITGLELGPNMVGRDLRTGKTRGATALPGLYCLRTDS